MTSILASIGAYFLALASEIGGMLVLTGKVLRAFIPPRLDGMETWRNLYKVGVKSFPIVVVTALLVGAIMVIQAGVIIRRYGAEGLP